MRYLVLALFILGYLHLSAQPKLEQSGFLAFICGNAGTSSGVVDLVTELLKEKEYDEVVDLLCSSNPAVRYLAVIAVERLVELDRYTLTDSDKEHIRQARLSRDQVSVCGGCTCFETIRLRALLAGEETCLIHANSRNWVKRYIPE